MIDLVLEASGLHRIGGDAKKPRGSGLEALDHDLCRTRDVAREIRDAHASLAHHDLLRTLHDSRVHHHDEPGAGLGLAMTRDIHAEHPHGLADLRRRDAHAGRRYAHRRDERLGELDDARSARIDLAAAQREQRLGPREDAADRHAAVCSAAGVPVVADRRGEMCVDGVSEVLLLHT
jgi:hypothetical protein